MSSFAEHINVANRNQAVIDHLMESESACAEWIVTVAFYKALHVVEAVFYDDARIQHRSSRRARAETMKRTSRYQRLWRHYRIHWEASLVARYLACEPLDGRPDVFPAFSSFIPVDEVRSKVLNACLVPFEASAVVLLGESRREHGLVRHHSS